MTQKIIKRPTNVEFEPFEAKSEHEREVEFTERRARFSWNIPAWSADSISWDPPSSFVIYTDGSWALAIQRLFNDFDGYGPFDRHFSVRFRWNVNYFNAQDQIIYRFSVIAGEAGYRASINNIVHNGVDAGYNDWKDQIVRATGGQSREIFY